MALSDAGVKLRVRLTPAVFPALLLNAVLEASASGLLGAAAAVLPLPLAGLDDWLGTNSPAELFRDTVPALGALLVAAEKIVCRLGELTIGFSPADDEIARLEPPRFPTREKDGCENFRISAWSPFWGVDWDDEG